MPTPSKFSSVLNDLKQSPEDAASEALQFTPAPDPPARRKIGRPSGRRSSSEYTQTTAYIETHVHAQVMKLLAIDRYDKTGTDTDYSGLVNRLLSEWLKAKTAK
jgi:hypothetical protein